jgi:hypothetical protein
MKRILRLQDTGIYDNLSHRIPPRPYDMITNPIGGKNMDIKMPIKFYGNYRVIIRQGDWESRERCQKLIVREMSPEEKNQYFKDLDEKDIPTHQINFYDFGCRRIIEGKLKENEEARLVFDVHGKEYEFSPL